MNKVQSVVIGVIIGSIIFLLTYDIISRLGVVCYNDFFFMHNIGLYPHNGFNTLTQNYLGLNQAGNIWNYFPVFLAISLLRIFSLNNGIISYLMSFGLLFISSFICFFIYRKISKSFFVGLFASVFVILNNLTIEYLVFGGMFYYFLGFISLNLLIYLFYNTFNTRKFEFREFIFLIILSIFCFQPLFFSIYLVTVVMFFITLLVVYKRKKHLLYLLLCMLFILLINSYWLSPFIFNLLSTNPSSFYRNENLENVYLAFKTSTNYISIINFSQYFNNISLKFDESIFKKLLYLFVPFLMILSVLTFKKFNKKKIFILIMVVFYLIFFNLALGPKSEIIGSIWNILWEKVSFFRFFRTFTRFLIILIPILLTIISLIIVNVKLKIKDIILFVATILFISINKNLFTGDLNGTILATKIPMEYSKINRYFIDDYDDISIISYPNASYESYVWGINRDTEFMQQNYYMKEYLFSKPVVYDRASLLLANSNEIYKCAFEEESSVSDYEECIYKLGIGYILLQKDLLNIVNGERISYKAFEERINKLSDVVLLESNDYFDIYRVNRRKMRITMNDTKVSFRRDYPTRYQIFLEEMDKKDYLFFLLNYENNWKLYINKYDKSKLCNDYARQYLNNIECYHKDTFLKTDDLSYIWRKPIFEETHELVYDYANGWTIDPEYIKANYPPEYYHENPDGSIDIQLTLYFKPQSYFYLGIIISTTTFTGCVIYLIIDTVKNRRKKKNNEINTLILDKK